LIDGFGGGDDLTQKVRLAGVIVIFGHRRSNVRRKAFLLRQMVVLTEKCQCLLRRKLFGVFGKWLVLILACAPGCVMPCSLGCAPAL
jgi:hypothetical protein